MWQNRNSLISRAKMSLPWSLIPRMQIFERFQSVSPRSSLEASISGLQVRIRRRGARRDLEQYGQVQEFG